MKKRTYTHTNPRLGQAGIIILSILAAGTAITTLAMFPGVAIALRPFVGSKKYSVRQVVHRNINGLIKHGLITRTQDKNGNEILRITRKGRWEAMLRHGVMTKRKSASTWDKLWRVIIFDVPMQKNRQRGEIRRALKLFGFVSLQKSVWVYPYECDDFVTLLKSHLGIQRDVLYMKVTYIENDKHLREEFNLTN